MIRVNSIIFLYHFFHANIYVPIVPFCIDIMLRPIIYFCYLFQNQGLSVS